MSLRTPLDFRVSAVEGLQGSSMVHGLLHVQDAEAFHDYSQPTLYDLRRAHRVTGTGRVVWGDSRQ
eukprot:242310-Pleurochrysis_carterae.AAC.2